MAAIFGLDDLSAEAGVDIGRHGGIAETNAQAVLHHTVEYTIETVRAKVEEVGLRTRSTGRWESKPLSAETLRSMLRDRYYLGWVTYKGVEYQGRHEAIVPVELFERVQRVLDAHQGAGIRQRVHHHYLKGLLWCARCEQRFIVQRAKGQGGGIYYYFFCRGRQERVCDHPYVPVEEMEKAVSAYYGSDIWLSSEMRTELRTMLDDTLAKNRSLSVELRAQYEQQLASLDRKENYFLDLAAEEGWPKEKLRSKITAIRKERAGIQASLDDAHGQLEVGRRIFHQALDLLERPRELYKAADEATKTVLNKAFFVKLYVDGRKVSGHEMTEPFDVLHEVYERQTARVYYRTAGRFPKDLETSTDDGLPAWMYDIDQVGSLYYGLEGGVGLEARRRATVANRPGVLTDPRADDLSLTDLLDLAFLCQASGSSRAVMVGTAGIEPATLRL